MITKFPPRLTIGRLIKEERLKHDHKQEWAAIQCGYSLRMWIYWERNEYIPAGRALNAITKLYPELGTCIKLHTQ